MWIIRATHAERTDSYVSQNALIGVCLNLDSGNATLFNTEEEANTFLASDPGLREGDWMQFTLTPEEVLEV